MIAHISPVSLFHPLSLLSKMVETIQLERIISNSNTTLPAPEALAVWPEGAGPYNPTSSLGVGRATVSRPPTALTDMQGGLKNPLTARSRATGE